MLMFITDFISDFHNLIAAIEDKDNSGYLDMIEKHLRSQQRSVINQYLNQVQHDPHNESLSQSDDY